jgi:hypothetical protein
MEKVLNRSAIGARELEFTTLAAARSGETRGTTRAEVDFQKALWIVPGTAWQQVRPMSFCLAMLPRQSGWLSTKAVANQWIPWFLHHVVVHFQKWRFQKF